ncbi:MAG: hypothetical protein HQ596_02610 [Candidatus Saganbacteria bacterium]|nr:hypothetical protein [Candidatus Saganbacteria bacterium]
MAFIQQPMIWPGVKAPSLEWESSFYNSQKTVEGAANLENFTASLCELFSFSAEDQTILADMQKVNPDFSYVSEVDYLQVFSNYLEYSPEELLSSLVEASAAKDSLEVEFSRIGEDCSGWEGYLGNAGVYDSQILIPLMEGYNNLQLDADALAQIEIKICDWVDNLDEETLDRMCEYLGVLQNGDIDEKREALKTSVSELIAKFSSPFSQFSQDAFDELEDDLIRDTMTPAIGITAVNLTMNAISNRDWQRYREAKTEAARREAEEKSAVAKSRATRKADQKKALNNQKARDERIAKKSKGG